jgi:uncharacterized DUF497 family protein
MMENRDELFAFAGMLFTWSRRKAASNLRKHRVSFAESATVFADEEALMLADPDHSEEESRFLLVGASRVSRILVVVSVERGERFRIISARKADGREREQYEERRKP